jgi:hypothetical protein
MSSLPGGSADKLGNRYELLWTVSEFLRMLRGDGAVSIRIEDPGTEKAEFVVQGVNRELHQAKRRAPQGKWSLSSLAKGGTEILQAISRQLAGNSDRFVFVSGSEAPELAVLSARAQDAESLEEYEQLFLEAEGWKAQFTALKKFWGDCDSETAFDLLRRIEVRTLDDLSLEERAESMAQALFLSDPVAVCTELRAIALDSVHRTVSRDALVQKLAERGFALRKLAKPGDAPGLVKDATKRYLDVVRPKLIRNNLLPRPTTKALLQRLAGQNREVVLTGKAGSGKTGCVIELLDELEKSGIPALAFRLDRIPPVSDAAALGRELGLEESPVLTLAAVGAESVLVIDQLDATSTASGRGTGVLDLVANLLKEIRGGDRQSKIHAVVVCRTFDWENDHRLRRLLPQDRIEVQAEEFSIEEMQGILQGSGFDPTQFRRSQLELLRLPQNLSLFLDAGFDPARSLAFNTQKELFDHYWDERRKSVSDRSGGQDHWTDVIASLIDGMTSSQQLFVPKETLDHVPKDYLDQMASEGVLTFDGKRYGFGHESFFDYCFARAFIKRPESLADFLATSEQHLFRRAQVRQVLVYLREADPPRYCREIQGLLTDPRIRVHFKDLCLALLADVPTPSKEEWEVWERLLTEYLLALREGRTNISDLSQLAWRHFFASTSWFNFVDQRGFPAEWLADERLADTAVSYLRAHQRTKPDRVAELLEPSVGRGDKWTLRLRWIVEWADHGTSRRFLELILRLIDDGTLDEHALLALIEKRANVNRG